MNDQVADAVRAELALIGTRDSTLQRTQRRSRSSLVAVGILTLAGLVTGAALVVDSFPGTTTVTPIGTVVAGAGTGTGVIDLGPKPPLADSVVVDVTCISAVGEVSVLTTPDDGMPGPDRAGVMCSVRDTPMHVDNGLLPRDGTTTFTVTADPGTSWKVTASYATSTATEWGVNAQGQTFGVPNSHGTPDLVPARATNGAEGYVSDAELMGFEGAGTINVYESDGVTVIGAFPIEIAPDIEMVR